MLAEEICVPDVDVAILGGGCAGLSLAARLARTRLSFRVIEPRTRYADDRTWSFWRTRSDPFEDCVRASWREWTIQGPRGLTRKGSRQIPYQTVSAGAFYDRALALVDATDGGSIALGVQAGVVTPATVGMAVDTTDGGFTARHVIDTRPPTRGATFGQFFLGREIVTSGAVFDPKTVQLMHFRRGHSAGVDFLYVLPFARDRALVEVTSFAPLPPSQAALAAWLDAEIVALGAADHAVLRHEAGALPMEVGYRTAPVPGVTHLGLAGGAARPSTGYAFQRIQAQADRVAESLLRNDSVQTSRDTKFTEFMDRVFLRVLATAPERGPAIFESLFRNAPAERLARFLSGSTRADDRLSVMASLPPLPFLRAASGLA